ncbi:MAG: hypothetical protein MUQ26_01730, partial [Armatimonadetes bacterium]|nr:hypothetical protein [Armatimonadota bacterium]
LSMLSEMESVYKVTPEQALAFHLAADAVALHDLIGPGKTVHCKLASGCLRFEDRPLAWLLVLCDELQAWGRPIPEFKRRGARGVEATFRVSRDSVQCEVTPSPAPDHLAELHLDAETHGKLEELAAPPSGLRIRWSPPISLLPV